MSTLTTITILATYGALGYWLVRTELLVRLHRRQIVKLINHHNNLRDRFGLFMLRGGQGIMDTAFIKDWEKNKPLQTAVEPRSYLDTPAIVSYPCDIGPVEDTDTASALPPFVQTARPWNKDVKCNTGTCE